MWVVPHEINEILVNVLNCYICVQDKSAEIPVSVRNNDASS